MFSTNTDPRADRPTLIIWLLPLLFVVSGLLIRFLAFRYARPDLDPGYFLAAICRWDCVWYVRMAETGYDLFPVEARTSAANWAFFPLYPMLVGLLTRIVPLETFVTASILSTILAYFSTVLAWPLLGKNIRAYTLYGVFMLSGPLSIYFTSFFTEVMFVLLTTLVFRALGRSDYLGAAVASSLLSATRIVGVFASLSLGLQALLDYRRTNGSWRGVVGGIFGQPRLVLAIFLSPLGLFAYMAFLHSWIGDGFAFSHVQRAWARVIDNPFVYLWNGLTNWPSDGAWLSNSQILALAAVVGLVVTAILAWRRQWPAALFVLITTVIPLAAGLGSMVRFMAAMAPVTITLATLLGRSRWFFALSFVGLLVGAWFTTLAWLGGNVALI
jgi:hypothetical protein